MFRLLIRDWYRRKTGSPEPLKIPAVMKENVSSNQGRATCLPVRLVPGADGYEAVPGLCEVRKYFSPCEGGCLHYDSQEQGGAQERREG